ncbi:DUF3667 domain-containing protein [Flavobacterium silvaticum]|uniref:DUF3667 domain-containing protein n=1 Tax=Flavobacterium silvaticum TaxID=1852020 RepID=A0A972FJY3_9FLAO|nr:DUF3667 domain-containing protein [Flavobacterium silvaticum]NMH27361.1 DUF3667 domain-containing protein [Flavobacterium silvaticum]
MSKHEPIRNDKTCLNCSHVVEERYCTHCGQENTDTRKTFHHLFFHFFEDLTHYENAFWRTIRHLLTRPGRLTKEYLSGKRLSYLAPIRLYIFISFITFFLFAVVPSHESDDVSSEDIVEIGADKKQKEQQEANLVIDSLALSQKANIDKMVEQGYMTKTQADSIIANMKNGRHITSSANFLQAKYKSVEQLDSVQKYAKPKDRYAPWEYWIYKRYINVTSHNTKEEMWEKFKESFMHNFPKVLFIYMPIFAFFLWLFNDKKRWYYFEHGIFTLHYFSFLLLIILINFLLSCLFSYMGIVGEWLDGLISFAISIWFLYYFFPAHHWFYGDSRLISFIKSIGLLFINTFLIMIIMILYSGYTLLYLH